MTSYLEFDSEKVDQNEVFHYKDIYYISSQNDPNITHTKNYIWGKSHFKNWFALPVRAKRPLWRTALNI